MYVQRNTNCPTIYPSDVADYILFYTDLRDNPCDVDKDYLIKRVNFEKKCVFEDTRDKLIERNYGFYVPDLGYNTWKSMIENQEDVNSNRNDLRCYNNILNDDYCIPIVFSLYLDGKKGNTNLTISNLLNLGETAKITVSNLDPDMDLNWDWDDSDIGIILDEKMEFVNLEKSEKFRWGSSIYYENVSQDANILSLEATIQAIGEGTSIISVNGRNFGDDHIYLNISNNTTEGWPIKNIHSQIVPVSLSSDKKQYSYPDTVYISGKFNENIGQNIGFIDQVWSFSDEDLSKLIYVDSENEINFQLGKEYFEDVSKYRTDNYYLVLRDLEGGVHDIEFSYIIDEESENSIYWKNEVRYMDSVDGVKEYLLEEAFFNEKEIEDFLKLYPEIGKFNDDSNDHQWRYEEPQPALDTIEDYTEEEEIIETGSSTSEYVEPSQEQQHQEFLDFFMDMDDEELGHFIYDLPIKEIKLIIDAKQYSEQQLRESLEQQDNPVLPKIYIDRLIAKIYS